MYENSFLEEEPMEKLLFLEGRDSYFDRFYNQTNCEEIQKSNLDFFPLPKNYDTYKKYENACQTWKSEVFEKLGSSLLPLPTTMHYKKTPFPLTKKAAKLTKFNPKKSMLNGDNLMELNEMVLTSDFIPDKDQNFEKPAMGTKHVKFGDHIKVTVWDNCLIPQEPMPYFYDYYEDYKNALEKWEKIAENTNTNIIQRIPIHPKELHFEEVNEGGNYFSEEENFQKLLRDNKIPQYQQMPNYEVFKKAPKPKDKLPIDFLHEIYRQNILIAKPTKTRGTWFNQVKKYLTNEKCAQTDEQLTLLEKKYDEINNMIQYGPTEPLSPINQIDILDTGLDIDISVPTMMTLNDFIYYALFIDVPLKNVRMIIERKFPIFTTETFPILIQLCKNCLSPIMSRKIALLINIILSSDSKTEYFDILFNNVEYLQTLCQFFGKYSFLPTVPKICYSLPLKEENIAFNETYEAVIASGLAFTLSEYIGTNQYLTNYLPRLFHKTSLIIQKERSLLFHAFQQNEREQLIVYHLLIILMYIPYRLFHSAVFSPSPINVFCELIKGEKNVPNTTQRVQRLSIVFETSGTIKSLLSDLIQFDIGLISKHVDILLPMAEHFLSYLTTLDLPLITRTQFMAQSKSFTGKVKPNIYSMTVVITEIFNNKEAFFNYNEDDMLRDQMDLVKSIVFIILHTEPEYLDSLFHALTNIIYPASWDFCKQFWMVFVSGLWKDNPVATHCWSFLAKIFELSITSVLPDFFESQVTTIFKPGSYQYCLTAFDFISKVIHYDEFSVLSQWFLNNETVLKHTFSQILMAIGKEKHNIEAIRKYQEIIDSCNESENKNAKDFMSIIKNEIFEKTFVQPTNNDF